jgi:hypothetical protein
MIRAGILYLVVAVGVSAALHAPGAATPIFVALLVLHVAGRLAGLGTPANCPYCRKKVKMGASHCHHCGNVVTKQRSASVADSPDRRREAILNRIEEHGTDEQKQEIYRLNRR